MKENDKNPNNDDNLKIIKSLIEFPKDDDSKTKISFLLKFINISLRS